jgi:hypothetical protein
VIIVLLLALFILNPEKAGASTKIDPNTAAMDFIRVKAVGTNINLRDKPSSKGRVLGQISGVDEEYYEQATYIAVSPPVEDKSDNSTWYKLFFAVSDYDGSFERLEAGDLFNHAAPYINARFVKKVPLTEFDKKQIDYFRQGRPPRYKTGDLMKVNIGPDSDRVIAIENPISLYLEPKGTAKKLTLPAGTKVIVYDGPGYGFPSYSEGEGVNYWHMDLDDCPWWPVIGENRRIIGWTGEFINRLVNWQQAKWK